LRDKHAMDAIISYHCRYHPVSFGILPGTGSCPSYISDAGRITRDYGCLWIHYDEHHEKVVRIS